ncbi:hypothetical protein ACHQM5_005047 [Ranunculus cassubicifolius]
METGTQQSPNSPNLTTAEFSDLSKFFVSLERKIAELESENDSLRNQAPVIVQQIVPSEIVPSETLKTPRAKDIENGHSTKEELKRTKDLEPVDVSLHKQKSLTDRQQENHDALIKCLMEDKRFDKDRPAAACIVYKSLLQWRSFEADKTHIFDRIIHTIRSSVEDQENINELAYWLSTTSTFLFLLQNTIKASNTASPISHRSRNSPTTLFSRMAQGLRSSPTSMRISSDYSGMVGKPEKLRIEAKYPALLFKQHLTTDAEKIYGMIRDSLKKEISSFLNLCIQAPRSARVRLIKGSTRNMHSSIVAKQQASSIHWQSIVQRMNNTLQVMSENHVPSLIVRKTFSQVFAFIDVQLFNSLLLRRECCSFSNGEYVKAGLQELEQWCSKATEEDHHGVSSNIYIKT